MLLKYIIPAATAVIAAIGLKAQVAPLPPDYGNAQKTNFIRTWEATAPGLDEAGLAAQPTTAATETTRYLDGLGRTLQTVVKQGSLLTGGTAVDMVGANLYDNLGREPMKYLPFAAGSTGGNTSVGDGGFKRNPFQQQAAFMQGMYGAPIGSGGQGEIYFYGRTEYEASPLGRLTKALPPGNSWAGAGRGSESKYFFNTPSDEVRVWEVTEGASGSFGTYTATGIYPAGELRKTILANEQGLQVIEFRDREYKLILKKVQHTAAADNGSGRNHTGSICTYYIYDEAGRLRCVLQPNAVEAAGQSAWALAPTVQDELCFRYEYDDRHRIMVKKLPGAAPVYMVYDTRDRLVLIQDGNLRTVGKWQYTQYDDLNRQTATGLWANGESLAVHAAAAAESSSYPSAAMLAATGEELTRTYYDDYTWLAAVGSPLPASYNNTDDGQLLPAGSIWPYPQANVQSTAVKGMVTGSRTKVVGTGGIWLYTVNFYDKEYRVIQSQNTNITGGTDIATTQYGWAGQPLVNVLRHEKSGASPQVHTVTTKMLYDNLNRLLTVRKAIASDVDGKTVSKQEQAILYNEYDALGRLKKKKLGATGTLESLEYDYNIRGWLLGANRNYIKDAANNYFGFELAYDKTANIVPGQSYDTPQYNGNINGTTWKAAGDGEKRRYDYSYDAVNRLTGADFNQLTGGSFCKAAGLDFSVGNLGYDANGNIRSMTQMGWKTGVGSGPIDQLAYRYNPLASAGPDVYGNRLLAVTDAVATASGSGLGDFKDGTNTGDDYIYDPNGNVTADGNKQISGIGYNHLNLIGQINVTGKGSIEYIYDALGNKLKKIIRETPAQAGQAAPPEKTTLYVAGFVYENDVLQFAPHEEGRARLAKQYYTNGDSAFTWQYDYFLKDHLGNVRTVITEQRDTARYQATFETAHRPKETALFANIYETAFPISNINKIGLSTSCEECILPPTGTNYPTDNTTVPNAITSRLNGLGKRIGAAITLKVMAGDKVDLGTKVWYPQSAVEGNWENIEPEDVLTSLVNTLGGQAAGLSSGKATPGELSGTSSPLLGGIGSFLDSHPESPDNENEPRAYLNWLLLDEQFNYVPNGSGFIRVPGFDDNMQTLAQQGLPIVKSGYLFVYLSNETEKRDVFFDNLTVQHYTGPLTEETQYYPYGLAMAGISSRAAGEKAPNRYGFLNRELQTAEFADGSGLEAYDLGARFYDPQTGRFYAQDPLAELMRRWSPYAYGFDNPVRFADANGMQPGDSTRPDDASQGSALNDEKEIEGVKLIPEKKQGFWGWLGSAVSTVVDYIPVVGSLKQIGMGIYNGDLGEVLMGVGGLALDVFTGGTGGNILRSGVKVGKELVEMEVKELVEKEVKELAEEVVEKEVLEQGGKNALKEYEVGTADALYAKSKVGDGLDVHHVSQAKPASQVIEGYNKATAPAIALRASEHKAIPTLKGTMTAGNARQQLAKDIRDLRRHTNAPNSSLQKLVDLNKKMYPSSFKK